MPWIEVELEVVERERVGVEQVCLCLGGAQSSGGVGEVDDGLAEDLGLVAAEAPVASVERFVDEHPDAGGLLPRCYRAAADVCCSVADQGRQDAVVPGDVGVAPDERGPVGIAVPLRLRGAAHLADSK